MFAGRTVFAQLIDHVPPHEFHKCVVRYRGNYKLRGFSCLDQFLCLAFAQLTGICLGRKEPFCGHLNALPSGAYASQQ
jgi:hypothetical protein